MKSILLVLGMAALLGTVVGCEEEREHHHRGGTYYGPEYPGYGQYRGYPDYNNHTYPYYQHPY